MAQSNLHLRSNVYLRWPESRLKDDRAFLREVRGRVAICRLLEMMGVPLANQRHDDPLVSRLVDEGKLTLAQKNALKWEMPCAACDSIPCGLNFKGELEFRCPQPQCSAIEASAAAYISKLVKTPVTVLQQAQQLDPSEALRWAIEQCHGQPPFVELSPPFAPIPLKISSAADAQFTEKQLAAFLVYGIQNHSAR